MKSWLRVCVVCFVSCVGLNWALGGEGMGTGAGKRPQNPVDRARERARERADEQLKEEAPPEIVAIIEKQEDGEKLTRQEKNQLEEYKKRRAAQQKELREAAKAIPLLWAPNMSFAVNLAMKLTEIASLALKNHAGGADVEIIERHHRFKEDAPSGTALKFGEIVAAAMGQTQHQFGRQGRPGKRPASEIGYHALRVGDNPGEHTIVWGMLGETLEVAVRATNRDSYAYGALAAAKFLSGKPPGMYNMGDVLGF